MDVVLELRLDARAGAWMSQRGSVRYLDAALSRLGIAFADASCCLEDLIEDEVLAELEAERVLRVVVVDSDPERRQRVVAAFRRAGCLTVEVSTPLQVLDAVGESTAHIAIAAVAELLTQTDGRALMTYLGDVHPGIRLAVIGSGDDSASPTIAVPSRIDDDGDALDSQIRRLVAAWRYDHRAPADGS